MSDKLAFPMPAEKVSGTAWIVEQPGMTLREWYTGVIVGGLLAGRDVDSVSATLMAPQLADRLLAALAAEDGE